LTANDNEGRCSGLPILGVSYCPNSAFLSTDELLQEAAQELPI
jgi:hypothetical protein